MTTRHPGQDRFVSATEISSLFHCEQKVVLDRALGETVTPEQSKARDRGNLEHSRADLAARQEHNRGPVSTPKGPCFVATHVYGASDPRTNELRRFRDDVLKRSELGRLLVIAYYRTSPAVVSFLVDRPVATRVVRLLVDSLRLAVSPWTRGNPCKASHLD